jgi:cytochrome c553
MMHPSRLAFIVILPAAVVLAGCGGGPAEESTAREAPAASAEVLEDMHEHVSRVRVVEEAVIRGDLEAAREPAKWLAEHEEPAGLPADTGRFLTEMRTAARQVAEADDIESAAHATARMAAGCGSCHRASSTSANLPAVIVPAPATDRAGHMREHQAAVDLLYRGLAAPSDENWKKGAEMLQHAPLTAEDLGDVKKEAQAAAARVHELGARAASAGDHGARPRCSVTW